MSAFYDSFHAMGTRFEMVLPGLDNVFARSVFQKVRTEVQSLDAKLSRFSASSVVRKINVTAASRTIPLDTEMWHLLQTCHRFYQQTCGAFDITTAPLLELWGFGVSAKVPEIQPDEKLVAKCLQKVGMHHLQFDPTENTIAFDSPGVQVDFGAIGKGYALDRARDLLRYHEVENALVSFGNSSILALGSHPFGAGWRVGVRHPKHNEKTVYEWRGSGDAISTSGAANRFVTIGGQRYSHIIDPRSGAPADASRTISVLADSATVAEVLSTSLCLLPQNERTEVLAHFPGIQAIEIEITGGDCAIVSPLSIPEITVLS